MMNLWRVLSATMCERLVSFQVCRRRSMVTICGSYAMYVTRPELSFSFEPNQAPSLALSPLHVRLALSQPLSFSFETNSVQL